MRHTFTIEEADRQALVLALALLALHRPGWNYYCGTVAMQLGDPCRALYRGFQEANRDVVRPAGNPGV